MAQNIVNNQLVISSERTIPIGAIKAISTSKLRDDWFSLLVGSPQEPDPLLNCVFKTEFFTHLNTALRGLNLKIGDKYVFHPFLPLKLLIKISIEYNKKPGKLATVKVIKDPAIQREDTYKSGTIHTGSGEPPNSVSKPTPRGKQVAARPVTKGKLLRPGGPGGGPSKLASRPAPAPAPAQPLPQVRQTSPSEPAAAQPKPVPQPVAAVAASHARTDSTGSVKAPPPPPPAAPPAPKKPMAKVLYDFTSAQSNELSVHAGDMVEVMSKEGNGKFIYTFVTALPNVPRLVALHEPNDIHPRLGPGGVP